MNHWYPRSRDRYSISVSSVIPRLQGPRVLATVLTKKYGGASNKYSDNRSWMKLKNGVPFRKIEPSCSDNHFTLKYTDKFVEASGIDELTAEAEEKAGNL